MGFFDFLKSKKPPQYGTGISQADKIFLISKASIVELKNRYKDLSDEGKFEVMLFTSTMALHTHFSKNPRNHSEINDKVIGALFIQGKMYKINMEDNQLIHFIISRNKFYTDEFKNIMDKKDYSLLRIYNNFYTSPLSKSPQSLDSTLPDTTELTIFYEAFIEMVNWIVVMLKREI